MEAGEESEFNMSFTLFYRLDRIFERLNRASLLLDLYLWYNLILVLYKEVAPLIPIKDRQQYKDSMAAFIPKFVNIKKEIDNNNTYQIEPQLYTELQDLEISLRDIVNSRGIYLRKKESSLIDFSKLMNPDEL